MVKYMTSGHIYVRILLTYMLGEMSYMTCMFIYVSIYGDMYEHISHICQLYDDIYDIYDHIWHIHVTYVTHI